MNLENVKWMKEGAIDLLVEAWSSSALTLQIRGLNENEMIIADLVTTSDRALTSQAFAITAPPRLLTVRAASTGVQRGTCFVRISLRVEGVIMATLFSDYVTDTGAPAYPNGAVKSSIEGPGLIRSITGTNPAASVEISETVPTGALWKLHAVHAVLVNDANVASRAPVLVITDGTNILHRIYIGLTPTAGQTARMTWSTYGANITAALSAISALLPNDLLLPAACAITTVTGSFQVGDNYDAPQLLIEEWINP